MDEEAREIEMNEIDEGQLDELLMVEWMLCAAMRSPAAIERLVRAGISEGEFEQKEHRAVWRAMLSVFTKYQKADPGLIESELATTQGMTSADAKRWVREIVITGSQGFADEETVSIYVEKMRHAAGLRQARRLVDKLMSMTHERRSIQEIVSDGIRGFEAIAQGASTHRVRESKDLATRYVERLTKNDDRLIERAPIGIPAIDRALRGGIRMGGVLVVGADTGIGKTTFGRHMLLAASEKYPTAYFTFETGAEPFFDGVIEMHAGSRGIGRQDLSMISDSAAVLADRGIYIDDTEAMTVEEMASKVHSLVRSDGVRVVFVDYVQDLERSTRHSRDDLNYAHVSKSLRRMASRYNIALVEFAQLRDTDEARGKSKTWAPTEADIAFTRQFAKDASYVLMLDRMKHADDNAVRNVTRCRLTKNRPESELVSTWMHYDQATTRLSQSDSKGERTVEVSIPQPDEWDQAMMDADDVS